MTTKTIQGLRETGAATVRPVATRTQLLETTALIFDQNPGAKFKTIDFVEKTPLELLKGTGTIGTPLDSLVDTMNEAGIPTKHTVGDVMEKFPATRDDIHELACNCLGEVDGKTAAARFRGFAQKDQGKIAA
ncbi:hypothetical protein A3D66_03170 [Candidatus Kaiserbacteria bacterium RIFCSPHIGHO2_02_FULL_50_9]|uniref:Uncharacterized protein n=1 Tax=Candidatus Kaiserbacteria bacterium RIFCSPLOWO2_01_FULL_51_21 TaxID=1798508 RepID=A0A1F6ECN8_9BACT|nr:MAG: hypothetical protein A2761_00005 [Candidatus Kaiserbacteria bacterium RIFCSPHIGHO2_01_FULL_51_33]OGG63737.1 MAG: hypothetical protein A3D66_03170 [Candidatus Kaiserbacteria bacterium RIFCSPHIGHO2_02_FULL_50_9]OGG71360.1 MAG: hypothetical protein A3A35_03035 [Candidatus Kaiserbacteria bacterium RIFCSPLOWO2_01_FULL_51_21]